MGAFYKQISGLFASGLASNTWHDLMKAFIYLLSTSASSGKLFCTTVAGFCVLHLSTLAKLDRLSNTAFLHMYTLFRRSHEDCQLVGLSLERGFEMG